MECIMFISPGIKAGTDKHLVTVLRGVVVSSNAVGTSYCSSCVYSSYHGVNTR